MIWRARNSSPTSLARCYRTHLTERIWLRCYAPSPKLRSAPSFIRKTLYEIPNPAICNTKLLNARK